MTNQQTLEKAIQKAIEGGWREPEPPLPTSTESQASRIARTAIEKYDGDDHVYDIIFSHDFAKALWGDAPKLVGNGDWAFQEVPAWQFHLKQMVIAEDPIKYLGEHI